MKVTKSTTLMNDTSSPSSASVTNLSNDLHHRQYVQQSQPQMQHVHSRHHSPHVVHHHHQQQTSPPPPPPTSSSSSSSQQQLQSTSQQQQQKNFPVHSQYNCPSDNRIITNFHHAHRKQQVLSRVPWFDATIALSTMAKGKARGNKSALRLRAKLQEKFLELGCFIQKHPAKVLFVGTLVLVFLSVTLKSATIETNIENLWVEVGGNLEKELNYIKTTTGEGCGNTNQLLIQTPKDENANVLNTDALLYHLEVLRAATDVTVDLFEVSWSLRDVCLTQPTPKVEEEHIQKILDNLFPCAIISPLDCFWEGSKLLSVKNTDPPEMVRDFLPEFKWTTLNPSTVLKTIGEILLTNQQQQNHDQSTSNRYDLQSLEKVMKKAGITTAYQERPCLNPYDDECPSTAPNKNNKITPDIGSSLTGGCYGFATKLMHWPEDLIVGGVRKNSSGHIVKASALQTIIQLMGEKQMYDYWASNNNQVHYIDWSVDKAKQVLEAWQREFSREVRRITGTLNNKYNYDDNKHSNSIINWFNSMLLSSISTDTLITSTASSSNDMHSQGNSGLSINSKLALSISKSNEYIVSLYTDTLLHDIMISCSSLNYTSLVIMLILITLYVTFVTNNEMNSLYSHKFIGIFSLLLIILSTIAALGTCKHLHVTFNATTTRIVPFICISLSVYILFLLCKTYIDNISVLSTIVNNILCIDNNIIGMILTQIGPVICLINTCLILAFLISSIIPIPLLRSFALQCAIIILFNTITSLTLIPAVMTIDLNRRITALTSSASTNCNSHTTSSHLIHLTVSDDDTDDDNVDNNNHMNHNHMNITYIDYLINKFYIPFILSVSTKYSVIFITVLIFIFTLNGIYIVKDGLDIKDIVPRDEIEYKFLQIRDKYFSFFNIFAITKDKFDYPNNQQLLQAYYEDFRSVHKIIHNDNDNSLPDFWLNSFRTWLESIQNAFDKDWKDNLITQESWKANASTDAILGYKLLAQTGRNDNPVDKSLVSRGRLVDEQGIINPKAFYNYLTAWVNTDVMGYAATQAEFKPEIREWTHTLISDLKIPKASALTYTQVPFFINRVYSTSEITNVIREIRDICAKYEAKGLPNFPTGLPFIYWEQYLRLPVNLFIGSCVIISTITFVLCIFFFNIKIVLILISLQTLVTLQLFGLMGLLQINMSAITVVILIITIGASTIFFLPITVSFLTCLGNRDICIATSLAHMLPPTVHGCVSLSLGISILAFSELDFIVNYFFYVLAGFILFGFFYGTLLLPIVLSIVNPESELISLEHEDRISTPTPQASPILSCRSISPLHDEYPFIPHHNYHRTANSYRTRTHKNKSFESLRSGKVKTLPSQYFSLRHYPPVTASDLSLSTIEEESRSNYQSSAEFIVAPPELVVKTTAITNVTSTPTGYHSTRCDEPPKVVIESPVPNSDSEGPESPISRDSPLSDSSTSSGCGMSRPNSAPGGRASSASSSSSYFLPKQTVTTKVTTTAKVKLYTPSVSQNTPRSASASSFNGRKNRSTSFTASCARDSRRRKQF